MKDVLSKIKSGNLYDLLAICSKEDLEPLVGYITDKVSNYLKKMKHTKYIVLITPNILV